jgi:hypothetical protein
VPEDVVSFYLKNKGKIPVAILSTPSFDATEEVDRSSLTFGSTGNEQSLHFCNQEEVNKDGLLDLICLFDAPMSGFAKSDKFVVLKG